MATKKKVVVVKFPSITEVTFKSTAVQQSGSEFVRTDAKQTHSRALENQAESDSVDDVHSLKSPKVTADKFVQDLRKDIDEGYLETVGASEDTELDDTIDGIIDIDYEQPTDAAPGHLLTGKPVNQNIFRDPKRLEEKSWNEWETFSAISGMSVNDLVHKAEVGDLVLDRRSLSRLQKRFIAMQKVYKRQYYRCGERYIIPEKIPTWAEDCKNRDVKGENIDQAIGDDALNQKVALLKGDISTLELDVIVNSISSHVTDTQEGVSKAIVAAASNLVNYELGSIQVIYVGEVEATAGYLLPAKYIFHTSGPTRQDEEFTKDLKRCYENCLEKMKRMGLRTLAFPCIATGAKKVDIKQAAITALTTVKEWLQKNHDSVDKIIFCVYDMDNWACYQQYMPKVFPPGPNKDSPGASLIPAEILRMDRNSIELYKRALSEGKEAVHNIRVMIVGHFGVGKTTLRKRLFGEDVDISKRESTDGIDVHVKRCKVSLDTGQWSLIDKDVKTEMICHRLIKLLKKSNTTSETANENKEVEKETLNLESEDGHSRENNKLSKEDELYDTESDKADIGLDPLTADDTSNTEENSEKVNTEEGKEEYILNHLKELIEGIQRHSIDSAESDTADLSVWDFAGQFVFYATHQVFLSRRAVYLLVTDISKHVQDVVEDDDCFIDSKGANHWKISEFVDFWLNSIHEFCNSPGDEGPPVILVGTFADKLNAETKEDTVDEFFYKLRGTLLDKATFCHLIDEDFAVDNSVEDINVKRLKTRILETASKQNYWGEIIPAKWIALESIIVALKDDGLKVLAKHKLHDLNKTLPVPIQTEEELELFLRFHHESGNILYFSDEKLQDSIILDPQWLIDAFKSLITAKMFCCRKPKIFKKWLQFDQSAILTYELVEAIWGKEENSVFHEHKELLLKYLERLGFIAKPIEHSKSDEVADYFAPCVLKTSPDDILECSKCDNRKSTSKLCFKTPSGFFPTAVFNKLLAACIRKWPLSKRNGKPTIFCGCGIFDLQDNHTLYIYFYDNVIQIWLTKLSTADQEPDRFLCSKVKSFVLDLLQNRFGMTSSIDVLVKCQTADLHSSEGIFAIDKITRTSEVVCSCRNKQHVLRVQDLLKFWQDSNLEDESGVLTDKEINRISYHIGKEYQSLAFELGLSKEELDHINLDFSTALDRIRSVLLRWKRKEERGATLDCLKSAMEAVGVDAVKALESIKEQK